MGVGRARIRPLGIAIGLALLAYSSVSIVAGAWLGGDLPTNLAVCHFLPCSSRLPSLAHAALWGSDPSGFSAALPAFQEALRRDPASPFRWSDLGEAYSQAGQVDKARYCFAEAVEAGPQAPPILLRAANFHFSADGRTRALELSSRCLAAFRDYDSIIFSQYFRMAVPISDTLRSGLPPERGAAQSFFRYWLAHGSSADLQTTWEWLVARNLHDEDLLSDYVTFLLRERSYDRAAAVQGAFLSETGAEKSENLLFNHGFERQPTGSPLDWRIYPRDHVTAQRDAETFKEGSWSLRIDFDGLENLAYRHVSQKTVLRSGRHLFGAWLRTNELTTDQGIRFRIFDPEDRGNLDLTTAQFSGTTDWTRVAKQITIPRETRLVEIQIVRNPSWKIDNQLGGTVWIDDVSLTRH